MKTWIRGSLAALCSLLLFVDFNTVIAQAQAHQEWRGHNNRSETHDGGLMPSPKGEGRNKWVAIGFGLAVGGIMARFTLGSKSKSLRNRQDKELQAVANHILKDQDRFVNEQNEELKQYYNLLQESYNTINYYQNALDQAGIEYEFDSTQRDYMEFKQPDTNGDDYISRKEFNDYMNTYLQAYPTLSPEDYPSFDEFDFDNDGRVSFKEWQDYLYLQELAAQQEATRYSSNSNYNSPSKNTKAAKNNKKQKGKR
jgi:Ca2+-binding EF-hand superfamily protein